MKHRDTETITVRAKKSLLKSLKRKYKNKDRSLNSVIVEQLIKINSES